MDIISSFRFPGHFFISYLPLLPFSIILANTGNSTPAFTQSDSMEVCFHLVPFVPRGQLMKWLKLKLQCSWSWIFKWALTFYSTLFLISICLFVCLSIYVQRNIHSFGLYIHLGRHIDMTFSGRGHWTWPRWPRRVTTSWDSKHSACSSFSFSCPGHAFNQPPFSKEHRLYLAMVVSVVSFLGP